MAYNKVNFFKKVLDKVNTLKYTLSSKPLKKNFEALKADWSSGQDGALSRRKPGFDSRIGHKESVNPVLFLCLFGIQNICSGFFEKYLYFMVKVCYSNSSLFYIWR